MKIGRHRSVLAGAASLPPLPPGEIIYGLRPPAPVPFEWMPLLIKVFAFWFVVWLLFRLLDWWKRRSETIANDIQRVVVVDHRRDALRSLERLKASPIWQEGRSKDICEALAVILKTYLHGRYALGAGAAATTDELGDAFRRHRVPASLVQETSSLLARCDEVKYARGSLGSLTFDDLWCRFQSLVTREDWRR